MEFVDIAGLVAGASKGEGLGNQFLGNIRETQAIGHVVRCFEDDQVTHVAETIDPARDIEIINTELQLADLETLERAIDKVHRVAKSGDKDAVARMAVLQRMSDHIDAGKSARTLELSHDEMVEIAPLQLLTAKPVLYIANVEEEGFENNPHLNAVRMIAADEHAEVVAICNKMEAEISELDDEERQEFLTDLGMDEPGLDKVIRAGYRLLGLQTYFTAGPKEARAWTVREGSTAPQAAGIVHTDFEKGFIRAEVVSYDDYVAGNGEIGAKEAGKWRLEGKEYVVQDGDVIHFRFNV